MIWLVDRCLRHPRGVGALAVLVLAVAVFGLTRLGTSAAVKTVVGTSSPGYQADRAAAERFGDDSILVLVRQSAAEIALSDDLTVLARLEQCLAGTLPEAESMPGGDGGPCAALARTRPAEVVYGPGTFATVGIDAAKAMISASFSEFAQKLSRAKPDAEAAARKAGKSAAEIAAAGVRAEQRVRDEIAAAEATAARYGITDPLNVSLRSTELIRRLLFDPGAAVANTPRPRFLPIFPTRDVGLVAMRLRADLTPAEQADAVERVRQAVALDDFRLRHGGSYVVSGSPVLAASIADDLQHALLLLLAVGVLVMALVLAVSFPERRRLMPLGLALGTVAVVFGGTGVLGWSLDLGTIATLPVLLGLAVDYGVQLHARIEEHRRADPAGDGRELVRAAAARGGGPIVLAAGATLAGFLVLLASPTPLVRSFGLVLLLGVAIAVLASFTVGLVLHARRPRRLAARRTSAPVAGPPVANVAPHRGIGHAAPVRRLVSLAYRWPRTVLAVGIVLGVVGAVAGSHERVETELQRLVSSDLPAVRDATTVQDATGQAGEVRVLIEGNDLATPKILGWIDDARARALRSAGYDRGRGCADADLCPLTASFDDLLGKDPSRLQDAAAVRALLAETPEYFLRSALTDDRTSALVTFGLPLGSTEQQAAVLERLRRDLADPPAGVRATVTGLPVLFADASTAISSPTRRILTLLGSLLLVGGLLLVVTRSRRRGLIPVLPVALAAGWSGLLTWVLGLPLNPLSVVLAALIVAIGTEFSVLLTERYHQERMAGHSDVDAIARAASSTGSAVAASAATTIAGFAVLAVSDIPLLRQFGLITVLDLTVAVLAVALVLPAVAGLAAQRRARRARRAAADQGTTTVAGEAVGG